MEEDRFCQSCAMPMGITDEHYGTNEDGSKSADYCGYCYENGKFTKELSMDEMAENCVKFMVDDKITEEDARKTLLETLPTLKRWRK
ncbi:MAG: zinc ribbon domain-containing protein [Oscillospiraceae bacterium]|jgi:pyruvoyl-dependent arginine decarboxylase (PvlArgDC)|nr:zinc ribbon domain-containing protein [Oscillospiraceae bacterium]